MINIPFFNFFVLIIIFSYFELVAQNTEKLETNCTTKSFAEIFKRKDSLLVYKPKKNNFFLIVPFIGSQPATGFSYGFISQSTFKGKIIGAKYSSMNLGAIFTEKKQLLLNFKNSVILNNNKLFFSGDWRFYIFSQANQGLGTDIIPTNTRDFNIDMIKEPMDYNYFRFHQTVSFQLKKNFYLGAGFNLDGYSKIEDEKLDVNNNKFTHHYSYSKKYNFNPNEYFVNGFNLNFLYDSRDNQVNPNNGLFSNINFRINPAFNENQDASSVLYSEFRYFLPVDKKNDQKVLCFWAIGQFVTSGNLPYLNLPSNGWDQRSRGGQGYTQGLFRGQKMMFFQTEYRFPITCNQLISGTAFASLTSTSNKDRGIQIFQYVQPAVGLGVRILVDKVTRTNIIMNYAWGRKSSAFYLNAGENF